ncbi:twin-arginine translocation signal domain-containing protein [Mycobacterium asiaticum]|uniref:twin-arginine translocation signal domain-containing protein n=1 Tax=Mycobacterium asiaticum TaxID=1790 RepID=UPI0020A2FE1D|nr:twin-arginine translocation signal domain-containing protein [Mycobacterium asiaticum]
MTGSPPNTDMAQSRLLSRRSLLTATAATMAAGTAALSRPAHARARRGRQSRCSAPV